MTALYTTDPTTVPDIPYRTSASGKETQMARDINMNFADRKTALETMAANFNADQTGRFVLKTYTKETTKSGKPSVSFYVSGVDGEQFLKGALSSDGYWNIKEIAEGTKGTTTTEVYEAIRQAAGEEYPPSDKFVEIVPLEKLNSSKRPPLTRASVLSFAKAK